MLLTYNNISKAQAIMSSESLTISIDYFIDSLNKVRYDISNRSSHKEDTNIISIAYYKKTDDTLLIGMSYFLIDYQLEFSYATYYSEIENNKLVFRFNNTSPTEIFDRDVNLIKINNCVIKKILPFLANSSEVSVMTEDINLVLTYSIKQKKILNAEWFYGIYNFPEKYTQVHKFDWEKIESERR